MDKNELKLLTYKTNELGKNNSNDLLTYDPALIAELDLDFFTPDKDVFGDLYVRQAKTLNDKPTPIVSEDDVAILNSKTKYTPYEVKTQEPLEPKLIPHKIKNISISKGHESNIRNSKNVILKIYNRLTGIGYSKELASGILGSLYQESKFDPAAVNPQSGATGIAQWLGSRKVELTDFAKSKNSSIDNLDVLIDFLIHELESDRAWLGKLRRLKFLNAASINDASDLFTTLFERPGKHEEVLVNRQNYSNYIHNMLEN